MTRAETGAARERARSVKFYTFPCRPGFRPGDFPTIFFERFINTTFKFFKTSNLCFLLILRYILERPVLNI